MGQAVIPVFLRLMCQYDIKLHTMIVKKQEKMMMKEYYEQMQTDEFPVAMAYVPWQKLDKIYEDLDDAFREGTIFPELNKPFCGRRCVK